MNWIELFASVPDLRPHVTRNVHVTFVLITFYKLSQVQIQRGERGSGPPWKTTSYKGSPPPPWKKLDPPPLENVGPPLEP